jgi:hypothetical protein
VFPGLLGGTAATRERLRINFQRKRLRRGGNVATAAGRLLVDERYGRAGICVDHVDHALHLPGESLDDPGAEPWLGFVRPGWHANAVIYDRQSPVRAIRAGLGEEARNPDEKTERSIGAVCFVSIQRSRPYCTGYRRPVPQP